MPKNLTCGVPQESVLGPSLLLMYANDMSCTLEKVKHMLYADDTVLYVGSKNLNVLETVLQEDLLNFCKWRNKNVLTINVKKTTYVIYGTSKRLKKVRPLKLRMNGSELTCGHVYRCLGIYLDSSLNFGKHIDYVNKIKTHNIHVCQKYGGLLSRIQRCTFSKQ